MVDNQGRCSLVFITYTGMKSLIIIFIYITIDPLFKFSNVLKIIDE